MIEYDTVVVGGGQAGLAMSAVLSERGREHVVLERHRVGERWRSERWDSLRFQFPNWSVSLPGYRYAGPEPDGFAPAVEIVDLLLRYASGAPVHEQTEVLALDRDGDRFHVVTNQGDLRARRVVLATGPFQRPRIPQMAASLPDKVLQTDPTRYRNPGVLPDGAILVVGAGASGIQIAEELLTSGRRVFLAVSRHRRVPRRFRGRDVYWWLERMGRFDQTVDSFPGRRWPPHTAVTGVNGGYDIDLRKLAGDGMHLLGSVREIAGTRLTLAGNVNQILDEADAAYVSFIQAARELAPSMDEPLADDDMVQPGTAPIGVIEELDLDGAGISTVIWATGYDHDYTWMNAGGLDEAGRPAQQRGVTDVPGLYFLGLHWMHTFGSGLLAGVGADAQFLADHIDAAH